MSMMTPWGASQQCYTITDGVYEVMTAGHGGIMVGREVVTHLLSPEAIAKGWQWGYWYAYEEDCDWAIFGYEQSELYATSRNARPGYKTHTAEEMKQIAYECLTRWHTDYLEQKGITV